MKLPEGWPTEEMCRGVIDYCNVHFDVSPSNSEARGIILASLAAAPTPAAQAAKDRIRGMSRQLEEKLFGDRK